MYQVNVFGPLALVQALAEPLINSQGVVVNVGSVGVTGLPFHGAYASSKLSGLVSTPVSGDRIDELAIKAAFQVLSDVLRREMAPLGLSVLTVELGALIHLVITGSVD